MNKTPRLFALCLVGLASVAACDAEVPEDLDYRAVGHLDLGQLQKAPWIDAAMIDEITDPSGDLGPCADVLRQTEDITFGAGEDNFEIYLHGAIDATAANACSDHIDDKATGDGPQPEGTMVADDLFAVYSGKLTPSPARLAKLQRSRPAKGAAAWVVANSDKTDAPFERMRAWATVGKGFDAHVDATFADESKAAELYGQANLGLMALRMSEDAGDLASLIDVNSKGRTVSADLHADAKQIDAIKKLAHRSDSGNNDKSGIQVRIGGEPPSDLPKQDRVMFKIGSGD